MFKAISIILINIYQKTISPDHGMISGLYPQGFCRYHPTCSQYTKEAIQCHGLFKGLALGVWRVLRCNPWSKGGYDPVAKVRKLK